MTRLGRLGVVIGWLSAAFVVEAAFATFLLVGVTVWAAVSYVLAVAVGFVLHERTRGPALLSLAFGLGAALAAQGVYFLVVNDVSAGGRRVVVALALSLPLALLVARRIACDDEDRWFRARARSVVPAALALAVPALVAGVLGARSTDPAPYERAAATLGHNPLRAFGDHMSATLNALTEGVKDAAEDGGTQSLLLAIVPEAIEARAEPERRRRAFERTRESQERLTRFLSPWSNVEKPILAEVRRDCGRFAGSDPERACECADELLTSRARSIRARREDFRTLGLFSALPWAIAGLFLWRGRRGPPGVHAAPAV